MLNLNSNLNEATRLRSYSDPLPELEPVSDEEGGGEKEASRRRQLREADADAMAQEMRPISNSYDTPKFAMSVLSPPKPYHSSPDLRSAVVVGEDVNDGETGAFFFIDRNVYIITHTLSFVLTLLLMCFCY